MRNYFAAFLLGSALVSSLALADSTAIPVATADSRHAPVLPNNQELYTLKYKATNAETVEELARLVRSFTPQTSRIIPYEYSGMLHVTDTAASLRKVYDLVRANDVKPTPEMKQKWKELDKQADHQKILE